MRRISLVRKKRKATAELDHADCHGIGFEQARLLMPPDTRDWPKFVRVDNPAAAELMYERFGRDGCWSCRQRGDMGHYENPIQVHHFGRSDELCLMAMLCRECHSEKLNGPELTFGRLLWLKWKYDRLTVDWVRTMIAKKHFLPDLVTDA